MPVFITNFSKSTELIIRYKANITLKIFLHNKESHLSGYFAVFKKRLDVLSKGILQFLGFFIKIVKTHNLNTKISSPLKKFLGAQHLSLDLALVQANFTCSKSFLNINYSLVRTSNPRQSYIFQLFYKLAIRYNIQIFYFRNITKFLPRKT